MTSPNSGLPMAPGGPTADRKSVVVVEPQLRKLLTDLFRNKYESGKRLSSSSSSLKPRFFDEEATRKRCRLLIPQDLYVKHHIDDALHGAYWHQGTNKDTYSPITLEKVYRSRSHPGIEWEAQDICPYSPEDEQVYLVEPSRRKPLTPTTASPTISSATLTLPSPTPRTLTITTTTPTPPPRVRTVGKSPTSSGVNRPPKAKTYEELFKRYGLPDKYLDMFKFMSGNNVALFGRVLDNDSDLIPLTTEERHQFHFARAMEQ